MTLDGKHRHEAGAPETRHPPFHPTDALGVRRYEEVGQYSGCFDWPANSSSLRAIRSLTVSSDC